MNKPTVGFIGVGSMGWPMAARIAGAGYTVLAVDADSSRARQFAEGHGTPASSADADMARSCSVVVTMLPTSTIVEQVLLQSEFRNGLKAGTCIVEMSSGVPEQTVKLAQQLASLGVRLLDAPVSGGVKRAETGDLTIMVGGNASDVDGVMPLLRTMGKDIIHTGGVGSAHAMKALNNLVSAVGFIAGIEALLIGKKFGLDPALMVDVLNASTGMNNSTQKKFKQFVLSRAFNSGFGLDLMRKDLNIALDLAHQTRTPAPLSSACQQLWESASNVLGAGQDHTKVAQLSAMLAGVEL